MNTILYPCKSLINCRSRINFMLETLKYVCNNNSKKIALFDPTILENLRIICRRLCKGKLFSIINSINILVSIVVFSNLKITAKTSNANVTTLLQEVEMIYNYKFLWKICWLAINQVINYVASLVHDVFRIMFLTLW